MDVPDTMKAAFVRERGPAEHIVYGDLPTPHPARGQVLVRVEAVAVNPVDTFVRSGVFVTEMPLPFVVGRDLTGDVAAVGDAVTRFEVGQRVWTNSLGHEGRQGAFAEYACVDADRLYHLPPGVDPVTAVAAFHPAATAYTGLFHHAGVRPGHTVFVGGGAGNVGSAVVQLASAAGCRTIASAHGEEDTQWCRSNGAELVVDYRDPELEAKVRAVAQDGVDVHWDTSGHHDVERAVDLLAQGGRLVVMAGPTARPTLPVGPFYFKNARMVGFVISKARVEELAEAAVTINRMLAAGALATRVSEVLPLARTAEVHRRMEEGRVRGRTVLRPEHG